MSQTLSAETRTRNLLDRERETLERFVPGLDAQLAEIPLEQLESPGSDAIRIFKESGGPALLVPTQHGGMGATPVEAIQVMRAIGSRAPSLAVATTMHHFSVASIIGMDEEGTGFEWMLLEGIAEGNHLLASGFAEGQTGQGVFKPAMSARREGDDWIVSGTKKPCSLSRSMDLLTASIELVGDNGAEPRFAVAVIASDLPGIEITPFWNAPVLNGAESDAITLRDVPVEEKLVLEIGTFEDGHLNALQAKGLLWFEALITASYLGMATALVERAIELEKGDLTMRTLAAAELEAAVSSLEGVGYRMAEGETDNQTLARMLACRFAAQDAITRSVQSTLDQLGGMAFIGGGDVPYLAEASRALGLHPPSRPKVIPALLRGLIGEGLDTA